MPNPDISSLLLEACVETAEQARQAQVNGARRIELCSNLQVGGLTPSRELIEATMDDLSIPVMMMIRPRAGNFVYTESETDQMKRAIILGKELGVAGFVFGCLTTANEIDLEKTSELVRFALPSRVTFHKAVDETPDPVAATDILKQIPGIQRILTSGGAPTALEGKDVLKRMIATAGDQLTILAAGKVTADNLREVHAAVGASEYHGRRIVF